MGHSYRWIAALFASFPLSLEASEATDQFAPFSDLSSRSVCSFCVGVQEKRGELPLFRAGVRHQTGVQVAGSWRAAETVRIRLSMEALSVVWPNGEEARGWGDLRVGTSAVLFSSESAWVPAMEVDWGVKLPNAADDADLGTDETDFFGGLYLRWFRPDWEFGVGGGLLILGDPLQFANQDDAGFLATHLSRDFRWARLSSTIDWRFESPRNPGDGRVLVGLQSSPSTGGVWAAVRGGFGLTAAAPDWQASVRLGINAPCRRAQGD